MATLGSNRAHPAPRRIASRPRRATVHRDPGVDLFSALVAGMVLTYVWRFHDLLSALRPFRLLFVTAALCGGVWLLQRDSRRALRYLKNPTSKWLLGLVLIAVLSIPTSIRQGASFAFVFETFSKTIFFCAVVASSVRSFRDVERLILVFVVGALAYASSALVRGGGGRLSGTVSYDPNDFSALLVITIPFAAYLLSRGRSHVARWTGVITLGVCGVVLALSVSRGGFLGFAAVMLYILFRFDGIPARLRVFATGVGIAALLGVAGNAYWSQMGTILEPSADYNVQNEASGRIAIWKRGVGYMLERPFLGVGPKQFATAEGRLSQVAEERAAAGVGFKWSAAHNSFVEIGAELGVTGLIVFLGMLFSAFAALRNIRTAARADPDAVAMSHALTAAILGFCVTGFFLSHAYYAHLYFLIALVIAMIKLQRHLGGLQVARSVRARSSMSRRSERRHP